ncbi:MULTISPECIES: hypothetical protein [unclassified Tolypothrix]|uniref:hypothetical protein n=1 Tax=unclassified Tolypothrix TaxID=2649714 RepID=UPI0005EAC0FE|nr:MULTISPECIES: hypothetical protein [unclassified Tolypothrix]BAY91754.1 hypothetical protein NIES3275_37810 [Microchaete diplosiphon NIES-3275]EKF05112.1 hypothetical protein FDUTEX481_01280 [Tolypothrix sp. PCC 7601]MBE9082989.1 hypothetical protein [Tolypothrix sp. LEGE 11397]UYD25767.1 hypothetical protein HGR01_31275 [Tolypothrix sp. PCC 7712]UYD31992.1 hypothetical protein HG267_23260 [Tolypothrix sp. PCC 7601]
MELVTLTVVVNAIASILWNKAQEKIGENIGDAVWTQSGKLIDKLRKKNKLPLLTATVEADETQRLDYGQAVLELKAAAEQDPEIAQAVVDVEAAIKNDQSETGKEIQKLVKEITSNPSVVNNAKLADEIKNVFQGNTFSGSVTFN